MKEATFTNDEVRHFGWRFWLYWVVSSSAGFGVGGYVGVALSGPGNIIVAGYVGITLGWICSGLLQWVALRQRLCMVGGWVPACIVASVGAGVVVFGVGMINTDVGWVLGATLFAPIVGFLQWRLVVRRQFNRAGWWVVASTVGWIVGMIGGSVADWPGFEGWAPLGAGYGIVTGFALVLLSRHAAKRSTH